jgi:flagellar biosynthesis protein FlhA
LPTILEVIGDYGSVTKDTDMLTEYVRQGLKRTITRKYAKDNKMKVIALDPELEKLIMNNLRKTEYGSYVALDPQIVQTVIDNCLVYVNKMRELLSEIIVLASPVIRFYFRKMVEQSVSDITVLSLNEIDSKVQITVIGVVNAEEHSVA